MLGPNGKEAITVRRGMTPAAAPIHPVALTMAFAMLASACGAGPGLTPQPAARSAVAQEEATAAVEPRPSDQSAVEEFYTASFDDSTTVDNEWFPFSPGTHWVYEGTSAEGEDQLDHRIEFSVTDLTKEIAGVRTRVAWIVDYTDGELVEKEIAFYAQANDGTVWYLGEYPEEYEGEKLIDAPTWIHGVEAAVAGIKMPAEPEIGMPSFSQGWAPTVEFTDRGEIAEIIDEFCVLAQCYPALLVVEESNPEEPGAFQLKYYSPGIGNVATHWRGADPSQEELELVAFSQLNPRALAEIRAEALALEAHAYEISPDVYGQTPPMTSVTKP